MKKYFVIAFITITIFACQQTQKSNVDFFADVIIYVGTSAAITAAVEVMQSGRSVIVVSPDKHLGGLISKGFITNAQHRKVERSRLMGTLQG